MERGAQLRLHRRVSGLPMYNRQMNPNPEDFVLGLPRRPKMADATAAAILGAIALGFLTKDWKGAAAGGGLAAALANQRQPLEFAVRNYLEQNKCTVTHFYRAPRMVKATFRYAPDAYWTVESRLPEHLPVYTKDDREDWLYGNLVQNELPPILRRIIPGYR